MSLDTALPLLVRAADFVAAVAAIVLAIAAPVGGLALHARLRRHPGTNFELVVPDGAAPDGELLFAHLHSLLGSWRERGLGSQPPIVLTARGSAGALGLHLWVARRDESAVRAMLGAVWPGVELTPLGSSGQARAAASVLWIRAASAPLRPMPGDGAAQSLARALARAAQDEELRLEITLQQRPPRFAHVGVHAGERRGPRGRGAQAASAQPERAPFACRIELVARAASAARARTLLREAQPSVRAQTADLALRPGPLHRRTTHPGEVMRFPLSGGATFGPADLAVTFPLAAFTQFDGGPTVFGAAQHGERLLGRARRGRDEVEVRLSLGDARHHLHLLGPTGTGKSTLLLNLAAQDIAAGRGCAVLDPKGDLVRDLLGRIPPGRIGDVVYIGPDEGALAVGLNPLSLAAGEDPDLAAENVLSIFKRIYHENWGPRTDDVLKSCLLTLLASHEPTLAHIPQLLGDARLRRVLTANVRDEIGLRGFWDWYEQLSEQKRSEATAPLLNKVRDFLLRPRLRRLLCQPRSTVDLRTLIDGGGILLADLGTGRWGSGASALAGSFLVARIWQAALARQSIGEAQRRDFQLYIDEFQTFLGIDGPFAEALAQARGLRLSLTLANQHLGQLPREVREAVRSNAGSRVVFRCGAPDARALEHELAPLDAATLLALPRFSAAARLLNASGSFTLATLSPVAPPAGAPTADAVLAASGRRFGRLISEVDAQLRRALADEEGGEETLRERMTP